MDSTKDIILQNKTHVPYEYTIRYICKYSSESRIMKKKFENRTSNGSCKQLQLTEKQKHGLHKFL